MSSIGASASGQFRLYPYGASSSSAGGGDSGATCPNVSGT